MKRTRIFAAATASLFASLLFAGAAGAVPVAYNEADPGSVDLGNNGDGEVITEFTLDLGENTVRGSAFAEAGSAPDRVIDFDDMILTVQPNQVITSATFSWLLNTGSNAQTQFRLFSGEVADFANDLAGLVTAPLGTASFEGGPLAMFDLTLPLGAGTYLLDQVSIGGISGADVDFDYIWTFNVDVVPLPPAAWLFMSGLLAMVGLSRRRKAT